jgi:hypothetical protein
MATFGLPKSIDSIGGGEAGSVPTWKQKWHRMKTEIDWIGAIVASTSLAMLSYVFATIAGSRSSIRQPSSIVLLLLALALIPVFIWHVGSQERLGKPAIVPNSLWRNRVFTTICIAVFFTWGSFNSVETILIFYFQDVQKYSATKTSIYFLPAPIAGVICNVAVGYLVHKVPANWLVIVGCAVSVGAPLAMVAVTPTSNYWYTGECIESSLSVITLSKHVLTIWDNSLLGEYLQSNGCRFALHRFEPSDHFRLPREQPGFGWWSLQYSIPGIILLVKVQRTCTHIIANRSARSANPSAWVSSPSSQQTLPTSLGMQTRRAPRRC